MLFYFVFSVCHIMQELTPIPHLISGLFHYETRDLNQKDHASRFHVRWHVSERAMGVLCWRGRRDAVFWCVHGRDGAFLESVGQGGDRRRAPSPQVKTKTIFAWNLHTAYSRLVVWVSCVPRAQKALNKVPAKVSLRKIIEIWFEFHEFVSHFLSLYLQYFSG